MSSSPAARSSSRPGATPVSAWQSWLSPRAIDAFSSAPTRSARTSTTCCARTAPRSSCVRPRWRRSTPTPTTTSVIGCPADPGCLEAQPVLQPEQSPLPLRDHRARDLAADRGSDHPFRLRHGHRRHDLRHRALPQGTRCRARWAGDPGDRRRSRRVGLLRWHRPPVSRRGRRRGFLARDLRPRVADRVIEVSDNDSFAITRRLAREEAMLVGGSAGMAAFAARKVA